MRFNFNEKLRTSPTCITRVSETMEMCGNDKIKFYFHFVKRTRNIFAYNIYVFDTVYLIMYLLADMYNIKTIQKICC